MIDRVRRLAATLVPALLILLLASLAMGTASAANLQISPVSISFRAGQTAAGVTLQNLGEQPLHGQVRVFVWDQKDGEDVLAPATDVVASPPIMEVAPNSTQTVRLVRRNPAPARGEQTYRILIDEIPKGDAAASGVAIRLQYSVPVFVPPADEAAAPQLAWSIKRQDGAWFLEARNDGALHAQLGATTLRTQNGKEFQLSKGLLGYALPGRTRRWRLPDGATVLFGAGAVSVHTTVNAQAAQAVARLD
ncbi:molecular chaperone [Massilia sp. G4R7]|uniref:Molecular chaperone n=1 Tax=Massilia phyllostachyos TaxID=2898585 RepID=A0ABS8QBC6_9BURK|nr:molecular chaperone [Massilia phyllostachyos]MCD2519062.1 molecular chaperone [Massilia phyllostachyos]